MLPPVPFEAPIIFLKTTSTNKTKHQAFGRHSCRDTKEMRCSEVWASDASAESRSANLPREEKSSKCYKTSIKFTWSDQHSKEKESQTWIQGSDPEQRLAFQMRGTAAPGWTMCRINHPVMFLSDKKVVSEESQYWVSQYLEKSDTQAYKVSTFSLTIDR